MDDRAWDNKFKKIVEKLGRDPAFARILFRETGNPYYAWWAIDNCAKYKIEFPEWLIGYLGACAERMLSDETRQNCSDLRKMLPDIFGFPRKRGPRKLLDPNADPRDTLSFTFRFLRKLAEGQELSAALKEAAIDTNCEDTDDKTLRRWVRESFGLDSWPRDRAQFIEMTRETMQDLRLLLDVGE